MCQENKFKKSTNKTIETAVYIGICAGSFGIALASFGVVLGIVAGFAALITIFGGE